MRYVEMEQNRLVVLAIVAAAELEEGFVGPDPKTVAPFEFVVFKTEELVLQNPNTVWELIHLSANFALCKKII